MRFSMVFAAALAAVLGASIAAAEPAPLARAQANYEAIIRGEKTIGQLTPTEQGEIRQLDRRVRASQPPDTRDAFEKCRDEEYAKLGREPSDLDKRVIDTRCR